MVLIWLGQSIAEDKIDEFTKTSIKRTSWESLTSSIIYTSYFRFSKINDDFFLDIKLIDGNVFSIDEGQKIMFKLSNDKILALQNLEHQITCTGCGAKGFVGSTGQGIQVSYPLNKENFDMLKEYDVLKIRIYTSEGFREGDLKTKNLKKFKKGLSLIFD